MLADDPSTQYFVAGAALTVLGVAVTQAGWNHRWFLRGAFGLGIALLVCAALWKPITSTFPKVGELTDPIGSSAGAWFTLLVCALISIFWLDFRARSTRPGGNSSDIAAFQNTLLRLSKSVEAIEAAPTSPTAEDYNNLRLLVSGALKENLGLATKIGKMSEINNAVSDEYKDKLGILRQEVTPLLKATIYSIYESKADKLLAAAPDFQTSDVIEDAGVYATRREVADKFVSEVMSVWRKTRFWDGLTFHLEQAGYEAEAMVRETPPGQRPPIDPLDYRVYAIAVQKSHAATTFLRAVKREVGDDYRDRMRSFIELHSPYEPKN
jgi:hypothetical protein